MDLQLAILNRIVPHGDELTLANFKALIGARPPDLQKKLTLFMRLIDVLARLRYGRRFVNLEASQGDRILCFLESSRLALFRQGFWGLRSLALLAHYADPAHFDDIQFDGPTVARSRYQARSDDPFQRERDGSRAIELNYDLLVIGSGAGGGVVAERLAELAGKGARIALLESGPWIPHGSFNQLELDMTRLFWSDAGILNEEGTMTLAAGRMVGGSTPIYTGVTFDLPEEVFNQWSLNPITYREMRERFERFRRKLNVHALEMDETNRNNQLFRKGATSLGWPVKDLELSVKNCRGAGYCNLGCVNNAKQSSLNCLIPTALDAGIKLIPNCHVEKIAPGYVLAEVGECPQGTMAGPIDPGRYRINAGRIVVAAGCYGTNVLLSRSGLKGVSGDLGRFVTMHPSLTVNAEHPDPVCGFRQFPKTYYLDCFSASDDVYLETAFYYPGVTAKNIEGWGNAHREKMSVYANMMGIILLNHDPALRRNRIYWNGKRPVLDYEMQSASLESLCTAQRKACQLFFAAGCQRAFVPFAKGGQVGALEVDQLATLVSVGHYQSRKTVFASAHPQGGCRMGKDDDAVCDLGGRLNGVEGVYVADASLFPTSSHVNPYLTVMALADVVADTVIADES